MPDLLVAVTVFLAIFLGFIALLLFASRSSDRTENRLQSVRDGISPSLEGDDQKNADRSRRAADRLFMLGSDSTTDLRFKLIHAGWRGQYSVLWYYLSRFVLAGGLGVLGWQVRQTLEFQGAIGIFLIGGSAIIGFALPLLWVNNRISQRRDAIRRAIPSVLDLIIVCVEAGLSLNAAVQRIAAEMKSTYPELAGELNILNQEIFIGKSRAEAFRNLARRTGVDELRSLATVLMQSDRMGTSIADVLRVQAETLRTKRRQRALEDAHKMPVKLVFPLVLFIFPEILVVLLGPAGIQLFRSLSEVAR